MANQILGRHPVRVVVVVVGLVLVLNLAFLVGRSSDTSEPGRALPAAIETVSPEPGTQADRRTPVTVDLTDDLTGVLVIDGQRIPEDQLDYNLPQGIITFRPRPDTDLEAFEAGEHTVQVLFWKQTADEPPDPDSYGWRFRATA
ncbi:MAG TPA: hypothetical protein VF152_05770 [Acidimicrobiia bacterium]